MRITGEAPIFYHLASRLSLAMQLFPGQELQLKAQGIHTCHPNAPVQSERGQDQHVVGCFQPSALVLHDHSLYTAIKKQLLF